MSGRMDASIILQGRQPNLVNALAQGQRAGAEANQFKHQNALKSLFQAQGPGIASGDPAARNALAYLDPEMAQQMDARDQGMQNSIDQGRRADAQLGINQSNLEMRQQEANERAKQSAAKMSAAERAQAIADTEAGLKSALLPYQRGDLQGFNDILAAAEMPPVQSLDEAPALFALFEGALEAFKSVQEINQGPTGFRPASPEEAATYGAAAGQIDDKTGRFYPAPKSNGTTIRTDENGNSVVELFGGAGTGLGTKATNDLQGKQINAATSLARLTTIKNDYKPEYLTLGKQLSVKWANVKDWLGTATPGDQAQIAGFTRFATKAFNNLNTTLKELSGAAVNEHEMVRLTKELPNVGAKIGEGDGPTEFKTKLDTSIALQRAALMRFTIWEKQGGIGNPWDIGTLDEMPTLVRDLSQKIAEELRGQGFTDENVVRSEVLQRLKLEYGIGGGND